MSKERRTVSLEEAVDDYLGRDGVNASELVNSLVKQHMEGGRSEDQIREFRKRQLKSEYEDLVGRARSKLERYNELENVDQEEPTLSDEEREEELQKLQLVPDDADHPLVQDVADSLGISPEDALHRSKHL